MKAQALRQKGLEMKMVRSAYLLVLYNQNARTKTIGSLGPVRFKRGLYIYVGSGGSNVLKRVKRHLKATKPKRWHIDYLTTGPRRMKPVDSYIFPGDVECRLARFLDKRLETIRKFGSSDCGCKGHLFYAGEISSFRQAFDELVRRFGKP